MCLTCVCVYIITCVGGVNKATETDIDGQKPRNHPRPHPLIPATHQPPKLRSSKSATLPDNHQQTTIMGCTATTGELPGAAGFTHLYKAV